MRCDCICACGRECRWHIGIARDLKWGERCGNCNRLHLRQHHHHNSTQWRWPTPIATTHWNRFKSARRGFLFLYLFFFLLARILCSLYVYFFVPARCHVFLWKIYAAMMSVLKPKVGVELDSTTRKDEEEEKKKGKTQKKRLCIKRHTNPHDRTRCRCGREAEAYVIWGDLKMVAKSFRFGAHFKHWDITFFLTIGS